MAVHSADAKGFVASSQSLAQHYNKTGFLKTYGNVSEAAKYLFKERLKARVTPTFYLFRNGELQSAVQCVPCACSQAISYFFQSADASHLSAVLLGLCSRCTVKSVAKGVALGWRCSRCTVKSVALWVALRWL